MIWERRELAEFFIYFALEKKILHRNGRNHKRRKSGSFKNFQKSFCLVVDLQNRKEKQSKNQHLVIITLGIIMVLSIPSSHISIYSYSSVR